MPNTATITSFLDIINNAANGHYHDANYLVNTYFVGDSGAGVNAVPQVAVTEHNSTAGPTFFGVKKVKKLFNRLFNAFPDVKFTPLSNTNPLLFLSSADQNTIAVQCTLTGTHQDWWFPHADSDHFYSKPLSDIAPNSGPITIPTCPVFTFDSQSNLITKLAIYMDRYHFINQLNPQMMLSLSTDIHHVVEEYRKSTR
jgi:hypothetical protein